MARRNVEVISCDWCGRDLLPNEAEVRVGIKGAVEDGTIKEEICSHCYHRLKVIRNWKETKEKKVSLSFNSFVETTLGEDAVAAHNDMWTKYGGKPKELGENWETQLHNYCQTMVPAFEKMVGSYQGVAFPFEMRMAIKDLREVNEYEND